MRFTLEGNNLRILFEEDDDPSIECFYTTRDVRTQQFGHHTSGRNVWYEPIVKSSIVVDIPSVQLRPDFELNIRALKEHNEIHPLDLHSIVAPESDSDMEVSDSDFDEDPSFESSKPKQRSVLQIRNARQDHHVWKFFGTGKHRWINGFHLDLNGLSPALKQHQKKILNSSTTKWNKGYDLVPITRGTLRHKSAFDAMLKKDPRCRFFIKHPIRGQRQVRVELTNRTEIVKLNSNNWVVRYRNGREVALKLRHHPKRREMIDSIYSMAQWWEEYTRLVPVVQKGVNRHWEGNWVKSDPEDINSSYILQDPLQPITGTSRITPLSPVCVGNFPFVDVGTTNRGVSESEDSD